MHDVYLLNHIHVSEIILKHNFDRMMAKESISTVSFLSEPKPIQYISMGS